MKKKNLFSIIVLLIFLNIYSSNKMEQKRIKLPEPNYKSNTSVEEAILKRRSIRSYKKEALDLKELSQILWAASGITDKEINRRAAPSAGALYPLEIYIVVGEVKTLSSGIYKYIPHTHEITLIKEGDKRADLSRAALSQEWVKQAPINIVICGVYNRIIGKYGERGIRYTYIEVGHVAQNIYLQAETLELGTVAVGAFDDESVKKVLSLPKEETPLYIMPIGKRVY